MRDRHRLVERTAAPAPRRERRDDPKRGRSAVRAAVRKNFRRADDRDHIERGKIALLKQFGGDEVMNYHKDRTEAES